MRLGVPVDLAEPFPSDVRDFAREADELSFEYEPDARAGWKLEIEPATVSLADLDRVTVRYHVTNQGACSRYEWAAEILEAAGLSDKVRLERARRAEFPGAARPAYSVLDTAPLSPRVGWREATRRVIASAASGASDPRGPGGAAG